MMRSRLCAVLLVVALQVVGVSPVPAKQSPKWRRYDGAWFSISYPVHFRVRPSLKSLSSEQGYDSAFFTSPDKTVEFYVFSPQWSGDPTDIEVDLKKERVVSSKTATKPAGLGRVYAVEVTWMTIRAKNGRYTRLYFRREEFADERHTQRVTTLVFGFKYTSQKAYKRYRDDYLRFQKSIGQYAD